MVRTLRNSADSFYCHYPAGATIVTSHAHSRDNAMAVAWHAAISRQPPYYAVSISPKRFTHGLIMESGEFVVNFMPFEKGDLVARVAGCSGRDVDKFSAFKIAGCQGSRVRAPVLADAVAAYECRLVGRHTYGDHDLFVGEVVAVHAESSALTDDGRVNLEKVRPIVYMGEDWYATLGQPAHIERQARAGAALGTGR
ncbi:MAG: flavin reductase family protein [Chloroflexi bacterium]|nr:flavin reductase family protein [Chloroflexota bacterium]